MSNQQAKVYTVFDTNVFVRAAAGLEDEHAAWGALIRICHTLVVSPDITDEYQRVIRRYGYSSLVILYRGEELKARHKLKELSGEMITGVNVDVEVPAKDLHFLKAAIATGATYLVTEDDRHFLSKKADIMAKHNIIVVNPHEYCRLCRSVDG